MGISIEAKNTVFLLYAITVTFSLLKYLIPVQNEVVRNKNAAGYLNVGQIRLSS